MKNLSIEKREYRDGIKRKETRQGWMDGWMFHGDKLRILLINRHMSYIVTADQIVSRLPFYTIPIFPLLNRFIYLYT